MSSDITNTPSRIAYIQSSWHENIVNQGKVGFLEKIAELGISPQQIDFYTLPGAFELPLKCQQACSSGKYAAVIAAGFVVDGDIYRHEFVAQAVISGLMQAQLKTGVPVLSMVLTPKNFDNSEEHNNFFFKHFLIKGHEIATAVSEVLR